MDINSVGSGRNYVSQTQPQPQTYAEQKVAEKENDNDKDDAIKAAAVSDTQAKPTVNTSGQTIGAIINVKA
jgi:hypothetical protein